MSALVYAQSESPLLAWHGYVAGRTLCGGGSGGGVLRAPLLPADADARHTPGRCTLEA